ncbi:MAG: adenosylcobalamin-dependent ribonucleoside-diphosphate reductase [Acidimicrobiia bacterium]|nr:adenosylcobalamin-dependent ribonucleoside-diphosphate reductase [Acidimicrobiia bacterium]
MTEGLRFTRRFTEARADGKSGAYDAIEWSLRDSKITNPDGSVVFEMKGAEIPAGWSQVAGDIMVSKYFRKAGVPQTDDNGELILDENGEPVTGPETSSRQVFDRLAETWRMWGEKEGYFASSIDADVFEDELKFMLAAQMAAPNSPQWFNTGLAHKYGITGTPQGFWFIDPDTKELTPSPDSYSRPAPHACFIQAVDDDLVNEGGIMDLWVREARLFKMGSGTGSNFSNIRAGGEPLSGGGKSSGLMSFLKVGDRAAGAIKSGGTTRRAAKMVILDVDHPDIEEFIAWKKIEEDKARVLIQHGGFAADFNGEAYLTVSGQNSNNSVRVNKAFLDAVENDEDWNLTNRTGGIRKTLKARDLWRQIADAAWACADPGMQYHTTVNEWHTSPAGGEIRGSNPCSEYMFLDDTACNLASMNLVKFYDEDTGDFDLDGYRHAIRIWTVVLEISVAMAHFPSASIAQGSFDYRTLGLGYANLGSLLMRMGIPYDSDKGRAIAGALTAIMTGMSYATSAEVASTPIGPFPKFAENRDNMLRVMRNHRRAAYNRTDYEGVTHYVMPIDADLAPADMLEAARSAWDLAVDRGERYGYRNAQATVLAPTGTIGLLMDCDTTGVEPDFALVKFKKLAGGGYFKIANQSIAPALRNLGYSEEDIARIVTHVVGTMSLKDAPAINKQTLAAKGLTDEEIARIESALPGVFELKHAFNVFVVGEDAMHSLGFTEEQYTAWDFDMLQALGFTRAEIIEAGDHICGRQTIEGAPGLAPEHLAVFDCANRNGKYGERFIHHTGHIKMMAAAQPFISGAISKTINMPNEISVEEVEDAYWMSYQLGVKAMALYRDGSKASQPLSSSSDDSADDDVSDEIIDAIEKEAEIAWGKIPAGMSPTAAYAAGMRPPRFLLPSRRAGFNQEARIGGHKVFMRTGEYDDGTLGEIFIDLAKEGATLKGILSCFAIAVSKGLQYGVPLEEFVNTFTFQTFEPRGMVEGHPNIKMSNSIVDYVFRALGVEYLHRDDLAQIPPDRELGDLPEPPSGMAVDAGVQLDLTDAAAERDVDAVQSAAAFADSDVTMSAPQPVPVGSGGSGSNGASNGGAHAMAMAEAHAPATKANVADAALAENMGDAPVCSNCGHMTVRNGSCYVCLTCGDTTGCS